MNNVSARNEVYAAIDSERDYQDNLAREHTPVKTPMEYVAIMRRILRDMEDDWYNDGHPVPLDYMRKIAGVAVHCMEQHGAPHRQRTGGPIGVFDNYQEARAEFAHKAAETLRLERSPVKLKDLEVGTVFTLKGSNQQYCAYSQIVQYRPGSQGTLVFERKCASRRKGGPDEILWLNIDEDTFPVSRECIEEVGK